ncbi:MAG: hypothetical protein HKO00_02215 [Flavobacteriaceae bacterium]|nr:hypothetical protein [Flavobacteriaceae bacterium]
MKTYFKHLIILSLFALFTFTSCQNEVIEVTDNSEETIAPNSAVANLMRSTASNDGSVDDVLDSANCISVNLPVTIIVNNITITINTLEDLEIIQELFDEYGDDEDVLEFLFPITIILNDYTPIVIENYEQLQNFIDECTDDNDVIECVDFVYPISFSIYNSDFQIIDTVIIENDEALYDFLEELENNPNGGAILASLNFPVSLVYANGDIVEVNSNQELEAAINAAEVECDDIVDVCHADEVAMYLTDCFWRIAAYNNDNNLDDYELYFGEDGLLTIIAGNNVVYNGNWSLDETDAGLVLVLDTDWQDLNGNWLIVDCDDDRFELIQETTGAIAEVVIERECENDLPCSAQEVNYNLQECVWYYGTNLLNNVVAEHFTFTTNGVVIITNTASNETYTGMYDVVLTDAGVFLVLDLPEPYSVLNHEWKVVECADHFFHLISGDNYLLLEQECQNEFDCPDLQANVGDDCETASGTIGFINENCECQENDTQFDCPDLQANVGDDCETANGTIGFINENCECQENNTQFDCPDLQANIGDDCQTANGTLGFVNENCECQEDDTQFDCPDYQANVGDPCENPNGVSGFLNENCECVVDNDPFECFGNYALTVCDDDVIDGFAAFDLNLIFANCPEDNVQYNFYLTISDAEAQVNPLSSPYTNVSNPQTIYSRVSLAGDPNVFELYEHQLIVEDCGQDACTEQDVNNILMECDWIPVSVNGSNDFNTVHMTFGPNQDLVIEGNGEVETGTWNTAGNPPDGVYILISGFNSQFQVFIGEWLVAECSNTELVLINNANDNQIILQRECN